MRGSDFEWTTYPLAGYESTGYGPGLRVLDLGCGDGLQLAELESCGAVASGLDVHWAALAKCRKTRLRVMQGRAEEIPLKDASLDGILCKVVLPYTDEARVLAEVGRLLKKGAVAHCVYHGAGYYLRYVLYPHHWKYRVYGIRSLVNTWCYAVTGRRLPGFVGDTLYQSRRRLTQYYRRNNLELTSDVASRTFFGLPVFLYHALRKTGP